MITIAVSEDGEWKTVVLDDGTVSNGYYYDSAFPSPIQVMIKNWIVDYDGIDGVTGHPYSYWYDDPINYAGFDIYLR